jgi:uncharacterized membrane protein YkgB
MTAKKMADVFFGNFSDLISKEKISRETDSKPKGENQEIITNNKINKISNKKIIIYISVAILLGIGVYFII